MAAAASGRRMSGLLSDFGPVCRDALEHPKVIEIMLNPDGRIFLDELGKGMYDTGYKMPVSRSQSLFNTIASALGTVVTAKEPILEGELPIDSSRFEGLIQPVVAGPAFAIRKKASLIFTLDDYERSGIITNFNDPLNVPGLPSRRAACRTATSSASRSSYERTF
jgi:Flp pilus assembly CpaF family ATPase